MTQTKSESKVPLLASVAAIAGVAGAVVDAAERADRFVGGPSRVASSVRDVEATAKKT